jgi:hypothetical protein
LQASEIFSSAYQLARLWKQSAHAKLLKQPLAAASSVKLKHLGLFQHSIQYAAALEEAAHVAHEQLLQQQVPADVQCFLQDVLASHAVATLAQLLAWLQQRPELLQLHELAADQSACSGCHNHGALWLACNKGAPIAVTHTTPCSRWKERCLKLCILHSGEAPLNTSGYWICPQSRLK